MKIHVKMVWVASMLLFTCASGEAGQPITLREAIATGLDRNHQVRAAGFTAEAAAAEARIAGSHYMPLLSFEESVTRANVPTRTFMMKLDQGRFTENDFKVGSLNNPAPVTDFRTVLTWEQPLFVPSAYAERRLAAREAEREELAKSGTQDQVAFKIFRLYLEAQKARAFLQAAAQARDEAKENRRLAGVRTAAGVGLKSDELRADTHLAMMDQQLLTATNNLTLARLQLGLVIGAADNEEPDTVPGIGLVLRKPDLNALLTTALESRIELRQARAGLERAVAAQGVAVSAYLPTIGGIASYQLNDHRNPVAAEHDAWMAGVTLRWNLFDGFRRENRHDKTKSNRSAAAEMLEQSRREVQFQVRESWLRHQEAEKRLLVARSAVASAEETVRLLTRRFENALATMVELLDAQTALNQARANMVESEADWQFSCGRVYYVAGTFLKEVH